MDERRFEEFAEDVEYRNIFFLVGSASLQNRTCFEGTEEGLDDGGCLVRGSGGLCYALRGVDLQGIVFLDDAILPKRLPCRFFWLVILFSRCKTAFSALFPCESREEEKPGKKYPPKCSTVSEGLSLL